MFPTTIRYAESTDLGFETTTHALYELRVTVQLRGDGRYSSTHAIALTGWDLGQLTKPAKLRQQLEMSSHNLGLAHDLTVAVSQQERAAQMIANKIVSAIIDHANKGS